MPAATPTEAGVHGEGQQMPRHERSTSGHSPRRDEVPDRRARRADAAAGREGSLSAERSSEKKVGSKAATVCREGSCQVERSVPCLEAAATRGRAQRRHGGQQALHAKVYQEHPWVAS